MGQGGELELFMKKVKRWKEGLDRTCISVVQSSVHDFPPARFQKLGM